MARKVVKAASFFMMLFVAAAIIGFLYNAVGGSPLFSMPNPDGRINYFYLTTFSNAFGDTIRPSAIYDEPGAFSFYICLTVVLCSLFNMSLRNSAFMLIGGLVTQSIAHFSFIIVWVAWVLFSQSSKRLLTRGMPLIVVSVICILVLYNIGLFNWMFERGWEYYYNPWKNPREASMEEIRYFIDNSNNGWLYGFSETCVRRLPQCSNIGENPLTPLVYGGLWVSWPYYLFLLLSFISIILWRNGLLLFGIGILLLQRPYFLEFPYSASMALLIVTVLYSIRNNSSAGLKEICSDDISGDLFKSEPHPPKGGGFDCRLKSIEDRAS